MLLYAFFTTLSQFSTASRIGLHLFMSLWSPAAPAEFSHSLARFRGAVQNWRACGDRTRMFAFPMEIPVDVNNVLRQTAVMRSNSASLTESGSNIISRAHFAIH
jgi:hypothetical protein